MEQSPKDRARALLAERKKAYQLSFPPSESLNIVLKDLAKFCRAHETTFNADPRIHAVMEGRREVWLRIQHHLELDMEQMWKIYGRD